MLFNLNNLLGKLPILVIIIIASHYHILAGVLVLLLFITLTNTLTEGMENNETDPETDSDPESNSDSQSDLKPSKDSAKEMFKQKFCVDGKLMKDDKNFSCFINENVVNYTYKSEPALDTFMPMYENWIIKNGYELNKVKTITSLIFLNMAPLHEKEFGDLLFFKSKRMLQEIIDNLTYEAWVESDND